MPLESSEATTTGYLDEPGLTGKSRTCAGKEDWSGCCLVAWTLLIREGPGLSAGSKFAS